MHIGIEIICIITNLILYAHISNLEHITIARNMNPVGDPNAYHIKQQGLV